MATPNHSLRPIFATIIGIAFFSAMDAVMKSASLALGAYSAFFLRCLIGAIIIGPVWWWRVRKWPERAALKVHLTRGIVVAFMGWTFFFALVRLPLAEAIALSFIAPLIALYLAAILLGEAIQPKAIVGALLSLAGVAVIVSGRLSQTEMSANAIIGLAALLLSAVLYAWNLILQRQQALLASPAEVSAFQNSIVSLTLLGFAPFLLVLPSGSAQCTEWLTLIAGALFAIAAALFLSWAYARAEAQALVPIEYTGFLWAALFGWIFFSENISITTVSGAVLIVIGCWIAVRKDKMQSPP
ncbi:DMT family transporter [Qipengyuania sp. DGS5-3]|uniref:DMT family transporter n=1 Tax=Qipengyuania sp. DGS5-3 TaxID=3349632 RepID=UPI0036D34F42